MVGANPNRAGVRTAQEENITDIILSYKDHCGDVLVVARDKDAAVHLYGRTMRKLYQDVGSDANGSLMLREVVYRSFRALFVPLEQAKKITRTNFLSVIQQQ